MDRFFDKHPHPSISWIHNLGKRRHGSAAVSLLAGARNVSDLATRHVSGLFCFCKCWESSNCAAHAKHWQIITSGADARERRCIGSIGPRLYVPPTIGVPLAYIAVTAFHDELDYISVHDSILVDMKSALAGVRTKQALDAQIETISKKKASKLQEMTALLEVSNLSAMRPSPQNPEIVSFRCSRVWFDNCCREKPFRLKMQWTS